MAAKLRSCVRVFLIIAVLAMGSLRAEASHIYGADLFYVHVSGNTYTIHLVIYGDCSGSAFSSLPTASPVIEIYNGGTYEDEISLSLDAPTDGVEVTPVCPADAGSTTCRSATGTIPGITKFVYTGNVTVSGTSSVWRFLFKGNMGTGVASAGRSNSITNIVISATTGSLIQLVDTLNNTSYDNNSAQYNTIPTPFFCINVPANFNPAAVDPDGDSLVFALVPGIDGNTSSSVTYVSPYTATAPMAVSTGTFGFSAATGQLSFTPNAAQKSLVVYNVEEFHDGTMRGTTQREMSIVVLGTCTNEPPSGTILTPSAGTLADSTDLDICGSTGSFSFHLNPSDAASDTITMTASGLPSGATFTVTGNSTPTPHGTFSWSTTGVAPGTYTFFVDYNDHSCPLSSDQTLAYTITIYPVPTQTYSLVSAATCAKKAVFEVIPGGSPSPYSISILEGATSVISLTGVTGTVTDSLNPGTYTIYTYNADNCYTDTTITIASPTPPHISIATAAPLCPGGATGSITATGSLGPSPYTYALGAGTYGASGTFTGLTPGTYTVTVKDANSCTKDTVVTVPNATPILMNISKQSPLCNSFANGGLAVSAYNSIAPYTYSLDGGAYSSSGTFTALASGTYTVNVKNADGCVVDTILTLTDSERIAGTISIADPLCYGDSGTITAGATGGFGPPYTYSFDGGAAGSTSVFTEGAGTYSVQITDPESCYFDTVVSLTQPARGVISTTLTNVLCYGTATGEVLVTMSGGTPSYEYSVNGGAPGTSDLLSGLSAGAQDIIVEDANGCIYRDTVTLTQPTAIAITSVTWAEPTCHSGTNGSFTIIASGGTPGYTYAYNSSAYSSSDVLSGLPAGTYTLYVKDANGCVKDTVLTLSQPPLIALSAHVVSPVCSTLANGAVTITAAGGTPGYTYALGTGAYSAADVFSPLAAGTYTFAVKDANGCVQDTAITLADSLHISGIVAITPALCYDSASGTITVTGTGGSSPYTYEIGTASYAASGSYAALTAGTYVLHIKDNNGCISDTSVAVGQPAGIVPSIAITEPSCYGLSNGRITVAISGGTAAYTLSFDGSSFSGTTSYTGLPAGTDSLMIEDAHGCYHDTVFTIAQPSQLFFGSISYTNISCNGGADGTVTVAGAGATAPYQYAANASPFQASGLLTGLPAGVQTVYVEDADGCEIDTTVTLTQPAVLLFTGADTTDPTCEGYKNGAVVLSVSGGTAPYTYSEGGTGYYASSTFDSLSAGTYTFYVKDTNGCSTDTTVTLTGLPQIFADNIIVTEPLCYGAGNGSIVLLASGGVPPLSYSIGSGSEQVSDTFDNLVAGTYSLVVTDSRNCTQDTSATIGQPAALGLTATISQNTCTGYDTKGAVAISVAGGIPPYYYRWATNDSDTTAVLAGLPNGYYTVWVTDSNQCADSLTSDVTYDDCCKPFIPNAFTPNNDGDDDIFRMRFKGDMSIIIFSVYNRFGQMVYSVENTSNADLGWDGKFNGINCDVGTYYYYAKIICGNKGDHTEELKGDVTLIR